MSSPFETAAEEARRLIVEYVAQVKDYQPFKEVLRLHAGLNGIEDLMQQPRTSLGDVFGLGELTANAGGNATPITRVRFDEFVGFGALDAAKRYLKKCSDARAFQEIVDAIKVGGGKIDNEENLRTGLSRSTLDIVKIGDRYGLLEHYPQIRRGAKRKKGAAIDVAGDVAADIADETATTDDVVTAPEEK